MRVNPGGQVHIVRRLRRFALFIHQLFGHGGQVNQRHMQLLRRAAHTLRPAVVVELRAGGVAVVARQRGDEHGGCAFIPRNVDEPLQVRRKIRLRVCVARRVRCLLVVMAELHEEEIPRVNAVVDGRQATFVDELLRRAPVLGVILNLHLVALDVAVEHLPDARLRVRRDGILLDGRVARPENCGHIIHPFRKNGRSGTKLPRAAKKSSITPSRRQC